MEDPPPGPTPPKRQVEATPSPGSCSLAAEKVTSLGKDWHRPCLRCERCGKTLTPGSHAEVRHSGRWPDGCTVPGKDPTTRRFLPGLSPFSPSLPTPSMMASPTATSPAMGFSSDPRVSALAGSRWTGGGARACLHHPPFPSASPAGVNTGAVGSYIYDKDPEGKVQP